jgi:bifunctional non-homologous end joining protein LigD
VKLKGAVAAPMPGFFAPMGAQIAEKLPKGPEWLFEIKWDGVRALTHIRDGAVTIFTRNNNRCDRQYPELHVLPHYIEAEQAIIDGEIVVLDPKGISKFELIQPRIHNQDANAIAKMAQKNPVHLYAFDLLYLDGYDLRRVVLAVRLSARSAIVRPHSICSISMATISAGSIWPIGSAH